MVTKNEAAIRLSKEWMADKSDDEHEAFARLEMPSHYVIIQYGWYDYVRAAIERRGGKIVNTRGVVCTTDYLVEIEVHRLTAEQIRDALAETGINGQVQ